MESWKRTINNWRDSFKIGKNHPERSFLNRKFGKMFTTTWFTSWLSTKTKKSPRQPYLNASKCPWFHAISTWKNSMMKIRSSLNSCKSIRKTSQLLKMSRKVKQSYFPLMWFASKTDTTIWCLKFCQNGAQVEARNFSNWITTYRFFKRSCRLDEMIDIIYYK